MHRIKEIKVLWAKYCVSFNSIKKINIHSSIRSEIPKPIPHYCPTVPLAFPATTYDATSTPSCHILPESESNRSLGFIQPLTQAYKGRITHKTRLARRKRRSLASTPPTHRLRSRKTRLAYATFSASHFSNIASNNKEIMILSGVFSG